MVDYKVSKNYWGWFVYQSGSDNYLCRDGKVRNWYANNANLDVYFENKQLALAALNKLVRKQTEFEAVFNEKDKDLLFEALDSYADSIRVFKGRVKGTAAKLSRLERIKAIVRSGVKSNG